MMAAFKFADYAANLANHAASLADDVASLADDRWHPSLSLMTCHIPRQSDCAAFIADDAAAVPTVQD